MSTNRKKTASFANAKVDALDVEVSELRGDVKNLSGTMEQILALMRQEQPPPTPAPPPIGALAPDAWRESDEEAYRGPIPPTKQEGAVTFTTALKPKLLAYVDYIIATEGGHRGEDWSRGDAVAYLVARAWAGDYIFRAQGRSSGLKQAFNPTTGNWNR